MNKDYNRAPVERRVRHKSSVETLNHFQCGHCENWWTIGDWSPVDTLSCPHCRQVGVIDKLMPNAELTVGIQMQYLGDVIEMGDLDGSRGLRVEIRPQVFIEISGFSRHDIMAMPNILYKKVKITIEAIDDA